MRLYELLYIIKSALLNDEREFEAKQILFSVLNINSTDYLIRKNDKVSQENIDKCLRIVDLRNAGNPLYYILGKCEFYSYPFYVGKGVLIPRADTEVLVDVALDKIKSIKNPKVLDLCSGSGCVAISIAKQRPDSRVFAVELFDEAYEYLKRNIKLNSVDNVCATKADALNYKGSEYFDLVVSNPPYINKTEKEFLQTEVLNEPHSALFADDEGYIFYKKIANKFKNCNNLTLAFEVGFKMDSNVSRILSENGYKNIETAEDLCGIMRVVSGQK